MTKQERIEAYLEHSHQIPIINSLLENALGLEQETLSIPKDMMHPTLEKYYKDIGFKFTDEGDTWFIEF